MFHIIPFLLFIASAFPSPTAASTFKEVNPSHSSEAFRDYIERALHALANSSHSLGRETFKSIVDGRVRIDEIADLTYPDFLRVLHDYQLAGKPLPLTNGDFDNLSRENSREAQVLTEALDGYKWDDRIYVSAGQSPRKLAATLVHEVNHVLNESTVHYYESHYNALLEEYRAFWVEAVFRGAHTDDSEFCRRLKLRVARLYSLEDVDPDTIPDHPPGKLIPRAAAWH